MLFPNQVKERKERVAGIKKKKPEKMLEQMVLRYTVLLPGEDALGLLSRGAL